MSIIQAAISKTLQDLKTLRHITNQQKIDIFRNAYFLFGRPFLQALIQIQKSPQTTSIKQGKYIIIVEAKNKKQIIFKTKLSQFLQIQCTCNISWNRKINKHPFYLCKAQIIYVLIKYCFNQYFIKYRQQQLQSIQCLQQILTKCNKQ